MPTFSARWAAISDLLIALLADLAMEWVSFPERGALPARGRPLSMAGTRPRALPARARGHSARDAGRDMRALPPLPAGGEGARVRNYRKIRGFQCLVGEIR